MSSSHRNEIAIAFEALSLQWNFFCSSWRHTHTIVILVVALRLVRYLARNVICFFFRGKTSHRIGKPNGSQRRSIRFFAFLFYSYVISILMNVPRKTCTELQIFKNKTSNSTQTKFDFGPIELMGCCWEISHSIKHLTIRSSISSLRYVLFFTLSHHIKVLRIQCSLFLHRDLAFVNYRPCYR